MLTQTPTPTSDISDLQERLIQFDAAHQAALTFARDFDQFDGSDLGFLMSGLALLDGDIRPHLSTIATLAHGHDIDNGVLGLLRALSDARRAAQDELGALAHEDFRQEWDNARRAGCGG